MRKIIGALEVTLVVLFFLCWPLSGQGAASGVITVSAKITSPTCAIGINGSSSAFITLPDVATGDFKNTSEVLRKTPFTIELSGCNDVAQGALHVRITRPIEGETTASVPATSGSAKDAIEFRLFNISGGSPAFLFSGLDAEFQVPDLVNGKISLPYEVGYRALKIPAKAGTIVSNLRVMVTYK